MMQLWLGERLPSDTLLRGYPHIAHTRSMRSNVIRTPVRLTTLQNRPSKHHIEEKSLIYFPLQLQAFSPV